MVSASIKYSVIYAMLCLVISYGFAGEDIQDNQSTCPLHLSMPLMAQQVVGSQPTAEVEQDAVAGTRQVVPFRAFVQSLLIPGWGQRYVGEGTAMGTVHFVTDVALWGAVVGFHAYGTWKKDAYKTFALAHANINSEGKDYQYYVDIGNYQNLDQYNEQQRRDRDFDELYLSDGDWWEWDSTPNRLRFKRLRIQSGNALNNRYYVLGAIFLNHVVSAIHASRQATRLRGAQTSGEIRTSKLQLTPEFGVGSVGIRLTGFF